ncbi:hypothetical protein THOE12_270007 [Vibrio rotiferianus]|nr:hypothetical protein THOE12_270007 [Vibrio rotiferianus]
MFASNSRLSSLTLFDSEMTENASSGLLLYTLELKIIPLANLIFHTTISLRKSHCFK